MDAMQSTSASCATESCSTILRFAALFIDPNFEKLDKDPRYLADAPVEPHTSEVGWSTYGCVQVFKGWFACGKGFEEMFRVLLDFLKPDCKGGDGRRGCFPDESNTD
jgi:hypothetical protein